MSLALIVYLVFTALPAIAKLTFIAFLAWLVIALIALFIGGMMRDVHGSRETWDWAVNTVVKKWAKVAIACLVVTSFVPTKEVTAYMLGAYGVQTIAENEKVQELGAEGLDVLQSLMKKAKAEIEEADESATSKEKAN